MPRLHFRHVSNQELIQQTRELVQSADSLEVRLIYHLDEIRCRGLESALGHGGTIRFAIEVLGMTPDQAAKRSAALTNCRRWPELLLLLEKGLISLSAINLVGPKLTEANKDVLLTEIIGKSTRDIQKLLASIDAAGQRREVPELIDVKLSVPADVLDRWDDAKALVCGVEMATLADALTLIVDDYLLRHSPRAKAERAAERKRQKREQQETLVSARIFSAATDEGSPMFDVNAVKGCRAASDGASPILDHVAAETCRAASAESRSIANQFFQGKGHVASEATNMHFAHTDFTHTEQDPSCPAISAETTLYFSYPGQSYNAADCPTGTVMPTPTDLEPHADHSRIARSPQPDHILSGSNARSKKPIKSSRYIPAELRHALWLRSGGRCEAADCAATQHLQIDHHDIPFSHRPRHDLDNLKLLCPACHKLKTLRDFGREWQQLEIRKRIEACDWVEYLRGYCLPPERSEAKIVFLTGECRTDSDIPRP